MSPVTEHSFTALIAIRELLDTLDQCNYRASDGKFRTHAIGKSFRLLDVSSFVEKLHRARFSYDRVLWGDLRSRIKGLLNEEVPSIDVNTQSFRLFKSRVEALSSRLEFLENDLMTTLQKAAVIAACIDESFENVQRRDVLMVPTTPHSEDCYRVISLNKVGKTIAAGSTVEKLTEYDESVMLFPHVDDIYQYTQGSARIAFEVKSLNSISLTKEDHAEKYLLWVDCVYGASDNVLTDDAFQLSAIKARDSFYGRKQSILPTEWRGTAATSLNEAELAWISETLSSWNGEPLVWSRNELAEYSRSYADMDEDNEQLISGVRAAALFRGQKSASTMSFSHLFKLFGKFD